MSSIVCSIVSMRRLAASALALSVLARPAESTAATALTALTRPAEPRWVAVHTWPWTGCADAAAAVLAAGGSAVDAAVAGAAAAEADPAAESVGRGAHPDAAGEVTLDALVMDGDTARVGAVGALRGVANAAQAALLVLRHSSHALLVGSQASAFAAGFGGLQQATLESNASDAAYAAWTSSGCQARALELRLPALLSCCAVALLRCCACARLLTAPLRSRTTGLQPRRRPPPAAVRSTRKTARAPSSAAQRAWPSRLRCTTPSPSPCWMPAAPWRPQPAPTG